MKANEIKVGGVYVAKVGGNLTRVRVDAIWINYAGYTQWNVTNLKTGRRTTFRSAAKFRSAVEASPRSRAVREETKRLFDRAQEAMPSAPEGRAIREQTRIIEGYDESTNPSNGWRAPERVRPVRETVEELEAEENLLEQDRMMARCEALEQRADLMSDEEREAWIAGGME